MHKRILVTSALLLASVLWTLGTAWAQSSANYNLEWHVIGGAEGPVSSPNYTVNSTAGQGIASPPYSQSGNYIACAGYWCGNFLTLDFFLPLMLRNYP